MSSVCPISSKQVNGKACQLNAFITVICIGMFLLSPVKWIIIPLAADFLLRGFINPSFSPVNMTSNFLLDMCHVTPRITNGGPKIFAAKIGFVFVSITAVSWLLGYSTLAVVFSSTLAFFAILEAVFSFCVACKAYPLVCRVLGSNS